MEISSGNYVLAVNNDAVKKGYATAKQKQLQKKVFLP